MSIIIKGMEMPKSCVRCGYRRGCCPAVNTRIAQMAEEPWVPCDHRHPDCPLVPVPPHGRLKRRLVYRGEVYNALEAARINSLDGILSDPYKDGFHDGLKRAIQILANEVEDAPTIIEAEEGE